MVVWRCGSCGARWIVSRSRRRPTTTSRASSATSTGTSRSWRPPLLGPRAGESPDSSSVKSCSFLVSYRTLAPHLGSALFFGCTRVSRGKILTTAPQFLTSTAHGQLLTSTLRPQEPISSAARAVHWRRVTHILSHYTTKHGHEEPLRHGFDRRPPAGGPAAHPTTKWLRAAARLLRAAT